MWHRAGQRFVVGAMFLVLVGGCSRDATGQTGDPLADGVVAAAVVEASAVPTTAIVVEPVPSPTALIVEQLLASPTAVALAPEASAVATVGPPPVAAAGSPATAVPSPQPPATAVPATTSPITDSQQVLAANGAEVYTLKCARCHAENGLGTQPYNAGLIGVGSQYSRAGMVAELTSGHPVTFGFADRLSAEEIVSVVVYVKSVFP